uniref:DUF1937 domain-containing protein n=1 Tax=viral metagenome TaxID=1070528 RepID=A0A6M3Y599_9ZZZZ
MPEMKKIYLGCPYSSDDPAVREYRFEQVNIKAGELMKRGHIVYSPISHSHPIAMACGLPLGFDFWEAQDRSFIEWSDEVWFLMLAGWDRSSGMCREHEIAIEKGKPVRWIKP